MRVLLAAYGSAGDVLPVARVGCELQGLGHEVRLAVPRSLGRLAGGTGLAVSVFGHGRELRLAHRGIGITNRFDGWSSVRSVFIDYVLPNLSEDAHAIAEIAEAFRPDLLVSTDYAAAARVAGEMHRIPQHSVSIYPFMSGIGKRGRRFALPYTTELRRITRISTPSTGPSYEQVAWGRSPTMTYLFDPLVLEDDLRHLEASCVGYPYLGHSGDPAGQEHAERVATWLGAREGPVVLITMGSIVSMSRANLVRELAKRMADDGWRVLLSGTGATSVMRGEPRPDVLPMEWFPVSSSDGVDLAVHHGGLGMCMGLLAGGVASLVLPQAYDQQSNARSLERLGVGLRADTVDEVVALARSTDIALLRRRARDVGPQLVTPASASAAAARRVQAS
jgi:rhamnosyltransferase subunit B